MLLLVGVAASGLLLLQAPDLSVAFCLCVAIGAFCRFYYFAFYVIERYVDSEYRFSGLGSFLQHALFRRRRRKRHASQTGSPPGEPESDVPGELCFLCRS